MVFTSVPFTSLAAEPQLFNVLPVVDPEKGKIEVATGSAASGSTVSYKTKAAYGYKHSMTNVEVEGASPSEVTGEQYNENTGWTSGEFTMPEANVKIHPYFDKDDIVRYAIEFVNEVGIHYSYRVDAVVDKFNEKAPEGTKKAAAGDEVTIYATSSNLDYKVVDVDIVGKESSNTVDYEQDGGFYTFKMPAEAVLIKVTEEWKEPEGYNISIHSSVKNGRIVVDENAESGETVTFTCIPDNGYALAEKAVFVRTDNEDPELIKVHNVLDGVFEFTMPNADVVIFAYFFDKLMNPYEIKDLSTTNCEVSFTKTYAGKGDAIYMDVFPDEDYYIKSVVVSGDKSREKIDCFVEDYNENYTTYKFVMPAENVNVRVICKQNYHGKYKIETLCSEDRGYILAPQDADPGDEVDFSVGYKEGWQFDYLYVYPEGGQGFAPTPSDVEGEYFFEMPDADVKIVLNCRTTQHTIDVEVNDGAMGSADCAEVANVGETVTVNVTAEQGYMFNNITAVTDGGENIIVSQPVVGEKYEFTMPDDNVTVKVNFMPIPNLKFYLNKGSELNGSYTISNDKGEEISESELGKQITVDYEPDPGYHLSEINITKTIGEVDYQVTNYDHDSANKCITFTMPNGDVNVELIFADTDWIIRTSGPVHGSYRVSKVSAKYEDLISVNVCPDDGYHYETVSIVADDGTPIIPRGVAVEEGPDEWIFKMPDNNVTVSVAFVENLPTYAITTNAVAGECTITAPEEANAGAPVYVEVECAKAFQIGTIKAKYNGGFEWLEFDEATGRWYFTMPAYNVEVEVVCRTTLYLVNELHDTKRGTVAITPEDPAYDEAGNLKAYRGDKVTVECKPGDGYKFVKLLVNDGAVEPTQEQLTDTYQKFSFVMPDNEATVEVTYELNGKLFKFGYDDLYADGSEVAKFIKSFDVAKVDLAAQTTEHIDIKGGVEGTILPETKLQAKLVLKPGYDLKSMTFTDVYGEFTNLVAYSEEMDEFDCNVIYTFEFEMPNSDIMLAGKYDASKFIVDYEGVKVDTDRDGSISTDCTVVDKDNKFLAMYNSTVSVLVVPGVDDVAFLYVTDAQGNSVEHRKAANTNYTWEFTMPDSNVNIEADFYKAEHTINADMSQSNGTYVVNFQSLAPAVSAHRGETVFVGTDPDAGYEVATVIVAKGSGAAITVTEVEANKYSFVVPDDFTDVEDTIEIAVTFQETIAKICQEAIDALVDPAKALNTISGEAAGVLANVGAAKDQAHTDAKREALKAAGDALQFAKNNVDGMAAVIADLKADSEKLRDKTEKTAEDRTAAEGYRNAARIYAGSYTVLVDACKAAITGTEAPLAIVEHSVTFNTDGGSEVASQWVVNNSKASKPNAPTKQGYYFVNWYSDASLTNAYDFEMPVDRDITIFAKWNANSSGGSGGSGGSGAPVKAKAPTYSANWYVDAAGIWRIKNSAGQIVASAWLCDDAVAANGQNVWYLLDTDGSMIAAGLVQDSTGNFYSIETNHNGYYGMLRYQDGYYDCNGRQVYLQFSRAHDGSFGAIINAEGLAALREIYGVKQFGINNSNCVYTKTF